MATDETGSPGAGTAGAEALAETIANDMSAGRLAVGAKLPSERSLSERFGIARGTVRRVLERFVRAGQLRRVTGSGTFVAALPAPANTGDVSPTELMEARLAFETQLAGMVVRNARPGDFAAMEHCLARAEAASSYEEFEHWDGRLHTVIGAATHNACVIAVLELMTRARESGEWGKLKRRALTSARRRRYERQHRALVAALRERDEDAATRLIRAHLLEVQRNLFRADHD